MTPSDALAASFMRLPGSKKPSVVSPNQIISPMTITNRPSSPLSQLVRRRAVAPFAFDCDCEADCAIEEVSFGNAAVAISSGVACRGSNWPATVPSRKTTTRSEFSITSGSSELIITTACPRLTSRRKRRWISALAPTSTPRVGSSRSNTFGSVSKQRPSTTFC